jgi:hypothetical protein
VKIVPLQIFFSLSSAKEQTFSPKHVCLVWVLQLLGCFALVLCGFVTASCSSCIQRWPVKPDHIIYHIQGVSFIIRLSAAQQATSLGTA